MKSYIYFLTLLFAICLSCNTRKVETIQGDYNIIPLPAYLKEETGFFTIDQGTWILSDSFPDAGFDPVKVFNRLIQQKSGYRLAAPKQKPGKSSERERFIQIRHPKVPMAQEQYSLLITPVKMVIEASDAHGIFYALQSLRQMMRLDATSDAKEVIRTWRIPAVEISDQPLFSYRGLHLDVCRHFFPMDFVRKYIDLLAYYKMNRFHWHLTEDQGWRIEIKKYPKLQEVAAWRDQTLIGHAGNATEEYDGQRYGGYYTQEDIKSAVQYATDRGVMIIPEIEMPGHSLAALAAYPELSCTDGPFKVGQTWGVFEDVYCPSEETFIFLQNVLDEVMSLFPSPYIHIGGDECPKKRWNESDYCQALMKRERLKDEMELQSYFIQRIEKYVNSKGKKIIGWDEILEGGLAPNATVMSWRGTDGGIAAARQGHDVIMTPGSYCYFDHYQAESKDEPLAIGGFTSVEKVYAFDPVPEALNEVETSHILGAQGNLWTEYITTTEQAEYMAYPRAMALAEVLWTPKEKKNWESFQGRLNHQIDRLKGMKVNYAKHIIKPIAPS